MIWRSFGLLRPKNILSYAYPVLKSHRHHSGFEAYPGENIAMKLRTDSLPFILLLGAQSALPPLSIDSSLPALPAIAAALQARSGLVQWTLSAFLIGFAGGQIVLGPMSDWLGRRPVLLGGITLFVFAGIGCSLATSMDMLVCMRMLQGVGACAGAVVSRAILIDSFSGQTAVSKQSVLVSSSTVAMLCAPVLGGIVLTAFGWRVNYALLPFSGILLGLCTAIFLPETRNAKDVPRAQPMSGLLVSYSRVLRDPGAVGFALLNAITFGGMFAYISGSSLVFIGVFGVSPSMFGLLFAAAAVALLAGSTLSVFAVKHMSPRLLRHVGLGILAIATSLLIAAAALGGLSILLIGLASFTFACGIILPSATAAAMASQPEISGAASGVVGATQFISGATAAAIVGLFHPGTVSGMVSTMAGFAFVSLALGIALDRRRPIEVSPVPCT
jgi:MFS transporter, DHA1 family, multidrug resistance protein